MTSPERSQREEVKGAIEHLQSIRSKSSIKMTKLHARLKKDPENSRLIRSISREVFNTKRAGERTVLDLAQQLVNVSGWEFRNGSMLKKQFEFPLYRDHIRDYILRATWTEYFQKRPDLQGVSMPRETWNLEVLREGEVMADVVLEMDDTDKFYIPHMGEQATRLDTEGAQKLAESLESLKKRFSGNNKRRQ